MVSSGRRDRLSSVGGFRSALRVMNLATGQISTIVEGPTSRGRPSVPTVEPSCSRWRRTPRTHRRSRICGRCPARGDNPRWCRLRCLWLLLSRRRVDRLPPNGRAAGRLLWGLLVIGSGLTIVPSDGSRQPGGSRGGTVAPPEIFEGSVANWSPDGTKVLFVLPSEGSDDIRVRHAGFSGSRLLGYGNSASWVDDDTIIVTDYRRLEP